MQLAEAFNSKDARFDGTFMFVDMCDSTGLKEQGEATWIPTTAWMYDTVASAINKGGAGTIIKHLGDGIMAVYGPDDATAALNDAIAVQEALEEGVEGRLVRFSCSIGIATGTAVRFDSPQGGIDYLGQVTDRASRLCDVASPQAIFVDTVTLDNSLVNRLTSKVGDALRRLPAEYKGEVQKAQLKGFAVPVEYHEIKWSQQLFGVKSKVMTASIDSSAPPRSRLAIPHAAPSLQAIRGERGVRGTVRTWNEEHRRGFIEAADGERFYTDMRFVVADDELDVDDIVYFVPRPPTTEGRARVAGAVVAVDQEADGTVVSVCAGFAFVRVADGRGTTQDIYASFTDCSPEPRRDQEVEFVLGESTRGARAEEVRPRKRPPMDKAA
jgi:class 3 adenylate cyclase/cold shock CspA family protein